MTMQTIVRSSLGCAILALSFSAGVAHAQDRFVVRPAPLTPPAPPTPPVPPTPPAPPTFVAPPFDIDWPAPATFPLLDLPPLPELPTLPDLPAFDGLWAFQDKAFAYQAKDKPPKPIVIIRANLYEQARNLIEQEQYAKALGQLDRLIEQFEGKSVAESTANRVDAALYWKAYAQAKQRQVADAMTTLQNMQKQFAESRWLKDAKALEVELRQASGQAVSPDSQTDEDLKLLALRGLMQSDPDRAVPMIEQVLSGNSSLKVKENALFVLSQSRSSRAHDILANVAKGGSNPDLQLKAIRYLGAIGGRDNAQILEEAYRSTTDEAVKRAILRSFMVSGNRARLSAIAADTNSGVALRGEAIQQLGVMRATDELTRIYPRETSPELKRRIIQGLFVAGAAPQLVEFAKAEKDMTLKKDIVQKLSMMKSREATDYLVELLK